MSIIMPVRRLWPLVLAGLSGAALAETAAEAMTRCASVAQATERLACFDLAASANPAVAAVAPQPAEGAEPPVPAAVLAEGSPALHTPLARQWDLDEDDKRGIFVLRAHKPTYMMPVWYLQHPNRTPQTPSRGSADLFDRVLDHTEAKFQISFKTKLWENLLGSPADLWFGYTQQSHWQLYNKEQSSPFRETDYEPELVATLPVSWHALGWDVRMLGAGLVHQSNGQSDPLSRSWNRVYLTASAERGPWTVNARVWRRLSESAGNDDNPDISKYMGYGDVQAVYSTGSHTFAALGRLNAGSGKGALQLDWTFPVFHRLRGYVQYFNGYGESLIDYNYRTQAVGVGLMLNDWLAN